MKIRKILPGSGNSIWLFVPARGVLFRFDPGHEIIKSYNIPRYINFSFVKDNTGCFWIGSIDSRIHRLVPDSLGFVSIRVEHKAGADLVKRPRITEDDKGIIRLALNKGIWQLLADNSGKYTGIVKSDFTAEESVAKCIFKDSGGNLWIGYADASVIKYSLSDNSLRKYQLPVRRSPGFDYGISLIQEDPNGNIYICCPFYGLFFIENGKGKIKAFLSWDEFTDVREGFCITDFMIDGDEIWIATMESLYRTDLNKTTLKDYSGFDRTGMIYGSIYDRINCDNDGNIWILNSINGPYLFDREHETFTRIRIDEEPHGVYFTDMNFDKYNNLWLVQNNSVIIVDPVTHSTRKIIVSPEKINELSSVRTKSGSMIYQGGDKIYIFPAKVPLNRFVPPVYMTGIYINGIDYHNFYPEDEPVTDLEKIVLSYKENHLKLEFAALNFLNPESNRYRYFMSGIDSDTSAIVQEMSVEYRKIAPGNYTFWFTGSNNDGIWNPSGKTLEISIRPPWYRSGVAYVIWFLMVAVGSHWLYKVEDHEAQKG